MEYPDPDAGTAPENYSSIGDTWKQLTIALPKAPPGATRFRLEIGAVMAQNECVLLDDVILTRVP